MGVDDLFSTESAVVAAATAAVFSPRTRETMRRGMVLGVAGAMKAGDVATGAARGLSRGVRGQESSGATRSGSSSSGSARSQAAATDGATTDGATTGEGARARTPARHTKATGATTPRPRRAATTASRTTAPAGRSESTAASES